MYGVNFVDTIVVRSTEKGTKIIKEPSKSMKWAGTEFKEKYNTRFYKVLAKDLTHNGFTYKEGLNIDTVQFTPFGGCIAGGLYFSEEEKVHLYGYVYGNKVATVTIPDDALVYVEEDKFKADKLEISNIHLLEDSKFLYSCIKRNGTAIQHVRDELQTEELCKLAVQQNRTEWL